MTKTEKKSTVHQNRPLIIAINNCKHMAFGAWSSWREAHELANTEQRLEFYELSRNKDFFYQTHVFEMAKMFVLNHVLETLTFRNKPYSFLNSVR